MVAARRAEARLDEVEFLGRGMEYFRAAVFVAAGYEKGSVLENRCRVACTSDVQRRTGRERILGWIVDLGGRQTPVLSAASDHQHAAVGKQRRRVFRAPLPQFRGERERLALGVEDFRVADHAGFVLAAGHEHPAVGQFRRRVSHARNLQVGDVQDLRRGRNREERDRHDGGQDCDQGGFAGKLLGGSRESAGQATDCGGAIHFEKGLRL